MKADNLVLKAARLLADRAGVAPRAALRLTKHIPVAAGLGGGSADAAAALRALIDLWRVALPVEELFDLAARLGADVPMCLAGRAALGLGRRRAAGAGAGACRRARSCWSIPASPLPTPEVFARRVAVHSPARPLQPWTDARELRRGAGRARQRSHRRGDRAAAGRLPMCWPSCARATARCMSRMSGSGATCFALYETVELANRAAARVPTSWWHHAGKPGRLAAELSRVRPSTSRTGPGSARRFP